MVSDLGVAQGIGGMHETAGQRGYSGAEGLGRRLMASSVEGCLGMYLIGLDETGVRAGMPIPRAGGDPTGLTTALNVLVDTAGGLAMALHRQAGLSGPTIELRMDHAAAPAEGATTLLTESVVRHEVGEAGYVEVLVYDDTGRSLGRACGHYLLPPPGSEPADFSDNGAAADCLGRPDPMLAALGADGRRDPADWTLPAPSLFANPRQQVHGGLLMTIGQLGQWRTQAADLADPSVLWPLSVQIDFQRPAPSDGGDLRCRTEYVRRGRRFRTLRSQLLLPDGRVCAIVTGLWSVTGSG